MEVGNPSNLEVGIDFLSIGVIKLNLEPFCHLTFRLNDKVILMGGNVMMSL